MWVNVFESVRYVNNSLPTLWAACSQAGLITSSSVTRTFTAMKRANTSAVLSSKRSHSAAEKAVTPWTNGELWPNVVSNCLCTLLWYILYLPSFGVTVLFLRVNADQPTCPGDLHYEEEGAAFVPTCSNPKDQFSNQEITSSCVCPEGEHCQISPRC